MFSSARRAPAHSFPWWMVLFLAAAASEGCNKTATEEQAVNEYFKNSKVARVPVGKFAGRVTVDGQPPAEGTRLFVILNDPEHLEKPGKRFPKFFARCDAQGNFEFTTYVTGDGVQYGKYLVTFAELRSANLQRGRGVRGMRPGREQQFVGPDELKNLYNDPQKNKDDQTFLVTVEGSGRADHEFNLSIAGKDPVSAPGEYAVTAITQ